MTPAERVKVYGKPCSLEVKTQTLIPDKDWERKNIVMVHVPWPIEHSRYGFQRPIRVHKLVVDKFSLLFRRWTEAGLLDRLKTFDGALNVRMKRGYEKSVDLSNLSTHSFGAAIDLNAKWNPLGHDTKPGAEGALDELVPIARESGFVWGGDWKRPDKMHFEVGVPKQVAKA